ncbi:hypothetical protein BTN49_1623 [Candidatus Enterovibrio escicola]|uniref:Uncharacterized protein n=1 Tax=Candidatus Enterovibrio escicola TaxID=1927127 RepID=A0A2A5T3F0_9GAMM|nr:hypothetical protein BTN49_1623 [Candidatus Enterovibrio escacola]
MLLIVVVTFIDIINSTFHEFKILTSDNGTEFTDHEKMTFA